MAMSTSSLPVSRVWPAFVSEADRGSCRAATLRHAIAFSGILVLATVLFSFGIGTTYESSDQAGMAYMVRHNYGFKWLFTHKYGLLLPLGQRTWAELLSRLHWPLAEASARWPAVMIEVAQVAVTFFLLRRLRASRLEALVGMTCVAILPTSVANAHYPWNHAGLWVLTGSAALWAVLAYLDDRRRWQMLLAAALLFAHCISSGYAMALPVTLMILWLHHLHGRDGETSPGSQPLWRSPRRGDVVAAFLVPCLLALCVIGFSWYWTGMGQIGMMLSKRAHGFTGLQCAQILFLPRVWCTQFGYLFGPVAGAGLLWGILRARRGRLFNPRASSTADADLRRGLLVVWTLLSLIPVVGLVNWRGIGYPGAYLVESVYCCTLLAVMMITCLYRRFAESVPARVLFASIAGLAFIHMALGCVDSCLGGGRIRAFTGVVAEWGSVRPDTGAKAAGCYVRKYLPMDAVVMPLHTNTGMEIPVAEYYMGRQVLASYDLRPEVIPSMVHAMSARVDVFICEPRDRDLVESIGGFELACSLTREGRTVRLIYARPKWPLPQGAVDVAALNAEYDQSFIPRHVPIPLTAPQGFERLLVEYQGVLRQLKSAG